MTAPNDLKYSPEHTWLRQEADGSVTVGITDHAQETLGDLVYVEAPAVGRHVSKDEACGVVESVKTASDVHTPASGEVIAVNKAGESEPSPPTRPHLCRHKNCKLDIILEQFFCSFFFTSQHKIGFINHLKH